MTTQITEFNTELVRQIRAGLPNPCDTNRYYCVDVTMNGTTLNISARKTSAGILWFFCLQTFRKGTVDRISRFRVAKNGNVEKQPSLAKISDSDKFPPLQDIEWIQDSEFGSLKLDMGF